MALRLVPNVSLAAGITLSLLCASTTVRAQQPLSFWKPTATAIADSTVADAASADFDGDGVPDIVVSTPAGGTIQVALGRGDGTFDAPASYAVAAPTNGRGDVGVADVNNDGRLDIVVGTAGLAVLLGLGDGTFLSPIVSNGSGKYLLLADFDGNGTVDVASVGKNFPAVVPDSVDIYPGAGDGSFGAPVTLLASDLSPRSVASGDLDGDGRLDLLVADVEGRHMHVYRNLGGLVFQRVSSTFIQVGPADGAVADMNGDGVPDVVTADFAGTVSFFAGNGDGTLQDGRAVAVTPGCSGGGSCPALQSLAVADFDLDGIPDVVTATDSPGTAVLLLNDGTGTLAPADTLDVLTHAVFVAPRDFDNDGSTDVAIVNSDAAFASPGTRFVSVFRNRIRPQGRANATDRPDPPGHSRP